jgi:ABC-type dipeptide/oligopeptide/nickel transport system ATPase component
MNALLEVRDYRLAFDTFEGTHHVLDGIDLTLGEGETLGIVGETGCGKSVLARSLLRLNESPPARVVSGTIRFRGEDILALPEAAMRRLRGRAIAMVFQDPATYLNPVLSLGGQMADVIRGQDVAGGGAPGRAARRWTTRPRCSPRSACRSRAACCAVPAPAFGRDASARADRDGTCRRAGAAGGGRADDGARRDSAGAGAGADRRPGA